MLEVLDLRGAHAAPDLPGGLLGDDRNKTMIAVGLDFTERRLCQMELPDPEPREDQVLLEVLELCGAHGAPDFCGGLRPMRERPWNGLTW